MTEMVGWDTGLAQFSAPKPEPTQLRNGATSKKSILQKKIIDFGLCSLRYSFFSKSQLLPPRKLIPPASRFSHFPESGVRKWGSAHPEVTGVWPGGAIGPKPTQSTPMMISDTYRHSPPRPGPANPAGAPISDFVVSAQPSPSMGPWTIYRTPSLTLTQPCGN